MSEISRSYQPDLLRDLKDPLEAAEYLNAAFEDGSEKILRLALRNVLAARGMLYDEETLQMARLVAILKTAGLRLAVGVREAAA